MSTLECPIDTACSFVKTKRLGNSEITLLCVDAHAEGNSKDPKVDTIHVCPRIISLPVTAFE
jgi:hypothetical protein